MAPKGPDLRRYMDKQLMLKLNANRMVKGVLRGYDQFLNIVLEDAEEMKGETGVPIGMIVVRGGSVVQFEQLTW